MLRFFSATSLMKKRNPFHSCQKPCSLLKNPLKDEPVMLAGHIQQEIKRVHEGLEMVGLLEGLAHFE